MPLTDRTVHPHTGWELHRRGPVRERPPSAMYWTIDAPTSVEEVLDSPFRFGQPALVDARKVGRGPKELRKSLILLAVTFFIALSLSELSLRDERIAFALASLLMASILVLYLRNARRRARHQRR